MRFLPLALIGSIATALAPSAPGARSFSASARVVTSSVARAVTRARIKAPKGRTERLGEQHKEHDRRQ